MITNLSPDLFFTFNHVRRDLFAESLLQCNLIELMQVSLVSHAGKSLAERAFVILSQKWLQHKYDSDQARVRIEIIFLGIKLLGMERPEPTIRALNHDMRSIPLKNLPEFGYKADKILNELNIPVRPFPKEGFTNKQFWLYFHLCHFIRDKRIDLVDYLLQQGADPNYEMMHTFWRDANHLPPLHLAAGLGDLKCVELLFQYGAHYLLYPTYHYDFTPLDLALGQPENPLYSPSYYRPHLPVVKFLLEKGFSPFGIPSRPYISYHHRTERTFCNFFTAVNRGSREAMELLIHYGFPMNTEIATECCSEEIHFTDCSVTDALNCYAFFVEKGAPASKMDYLNRVYEHFEDCPVVEDFSKARALTEFLRSKGAPIDPISWLDI